MTSPSSLSLPFLMKGLSEWASAYDVILCDVWGVLHNGHGAFPAACQALQKFRRLGGTIILITNSPRPQASVRQQLDLQGVPQDAYDGLVTSGDVTVHLMKAHGSAPLHHIGPPRDEVFFDLLTQTLDTRPRLVSLEEASYVVCTGLRDDRVETPKDYEACLSQMAAKALPMVCANPDHVVHVGAQLIYCAGALAAAYEAKGGTVTQAGKPYAPIYEEALQEAERLRGTGSIPREKILAIGDSFPTDMRGAYNQGLDSLFVTSGIHREDLYKAHNIQGRVLDLDACTLLFTPLGFTPKGMIESLTW